MSKVFEIVKLMRPSHWIKNILIIFPLFFGGKFLDVDLLLFVLAGGVSFSLLSSMVYTINDISDLESDRLHAIKKNRPIASGKISKREASLLLFVMGIIVVLDSMLIVKNMLAFCILILYGFINIGYSCFKWKNIPLLDICILVSCYVIRIAYGAVIAKVSISNWLFLTIMSVSFFMALGKRRNEMNMNIKLTCDSATTRDVLKWYPLSFLDKNMTMCNTLAILFYTLWCIDFSSGRTGVNSNNLNIIWTVPIVILLSMRYSYIIEMKNFEEDPIRVILKDKVLITIGIAYAILMFVIIYI